MTFLTFYKEPTDLSKIIFQNRFFHDNADRFTLKINDIFVNLFSQGDAHKFIFGNTNTLVGKSTMNK